MIKNKTKLIGISLLLYSTLVLSSVFSTAEAQCVNTVPNPLNPNCEKRVISVGTILNRFIQLVPFIITVAAILAIIRGAIKIMFADDAEKRGEGFKIIINAAIGAAVFYSIWMILYFIELATGGKLLVF